MPRRIALALLALALVGCGGSRSTRNTRVGPQSNVITLEEIPRANASTAYDLVQKLRPHFFRVVRSAGGQRPVVYLDDARLGAPSELRGIDVGSIYEIRFIEAPDATIRWGTNHAGGVILVTSKARAMR